MEVETKDYQKLIQAFVKEQEIDRKKLLTIQAYQRTLEEFFLEYLPNFNDTKLTTQKIKGFIPFKEQKAITRQNSGVKGIGIGRQMITEQLSSATINRHNSALRQFLYFIGENKLAKDIKMMKKNPDYDTLEYQDIKKIFDKQTIIDYYKTQNGKPENKEFYIRRMLLLVDFVFSTGVRAEETFKTKKTDLKLDRDIPIVEITGKGGKKRIVELSRVWLKQFKHFLEDYPNIEGSEYIFTDIAGNRLSYSTLKVYIKNLGHFIGVPKLSIHKLRHAYAIKSYEQNNDIVKLSKRLGHDSVTTTQIYLSKVLTTETALKSPLDEVEK